MYYIFNQHGEYIATSDHAPNLDDLALRGEQAVESQEYFANPALIEGEIVEKGHAPSPYHRWRQGEWYIPAELQSQWKSEQQAQVWEQIKQRRYQNGLGGVYIASVDKWMQTGEEEKTKYLGLDKVIDKLGEIDWKTADNSFVKMSRALLDEIFVEIVRTENADHQNAERHRALMLQAENPMEYDYSDGWQPTFAKSHLKQTA